MLALTTSLLGALALATPSPLVREVSETQAPTGTRRVALIVGANDGGPGRARLRYAGSDARSFAQVLAEIGGISQRDAIVLIDPSPRQLVAGFTKAQQRVQQARGRGESVQFIFYYSGHADDLGLQLGDEALGYPRLRGLIDSVPAQVRLGLLDSCSSGAFVRRKGGRMRPPLATDNAGIEGHAYLTSSSAEEAAQESDRIGGSFFTHYLVSGLRGAADVNRDRQVTLHEAYRFAFDETLASTETTLGRAQHPVYDIQLVGTGDLVMTDLRETSALLDIHPNLGGRVYVRDREGRLVAELYKGVGSGSVALALEPGLYNIVVDDGTKLSRASIEVRAGTKNELTRADLQVVPGEPTTARGDVPLDTNQYRVMPVGFALFPPLTTNNIERRRKVINRFGINLILGRAAQIRGAELSLGGNWTEEHVSGVQLSLAANYVGGDVRGFQSTTGVNVVRGSVYGLQSAAAVNVTRGDLRGLQAAAAVNVLTGHARGLQATAGVNWARSIGGAQVAPINAAREVVGAQIGMINVASGKVRGAQVGLINFADEVDASVGLIGISRKGGVFADVWTSDIAALNVAVKFRAKYTYTYLGAGLHPGGAGRGVMFGGGFGGHIPVAKRWYIDLDLGSYAVYPRFNFRQDSAVLSTLRLLLGFQVTRRFAVWGGPTANMTIDFAGDRPRLGYGWVVGRQPIDPYSVRMWPGFVLGVQL